MFEEFSPVHKLLISVLIGYMLGSVPFAHLAARLRGSDIFTTGSRTAGTANVFWNIGRRIGVVVLVGDVSKGSLAILAGQYLGITGPLLLLAGGAVVVGHWNSIFTGFRGGDGMAALMGVTLVVATQLAILGIGAGLVAVILLWRSPFRSAIGIATCFTVMLGVSQYYQISRDLVLGLVILAMLVLFHNFFFHRKRLHTIDASEFDDEFDLDGDADLGLPPAHENH